jgi:hypothetical protein
MGLVSAASTILINVEPRTHLLRWRTIRRFARKSCPRSTANTRCGRAGREGARLPSGSCRRPKSGIRDVQVNVDVAGRHVIEKDANSSMVTDWTVALRAPDPASRSRPPGLARRRQTLLRKDLCATGSEKDSGRGFDQPEEGTRKLDRVAGASLTCEPGLPSGVLGLGELAGPTRQNPAAPTCRRAGLLRPPQLQRIHRSHRRMRGSATRQRPRRSHAPAWRRDHLELRPRPTQVQRDHGSRSLRRLPSLPGATGNRHHQAPRAGAELDDNRRVGIMGDRTQRRRAIGA